jgi:hypothetical protein
MLYKAKVDKDINVKSCQIVGNGDIFGYVLVETYFVDNSGFGDSGEPALIFNDFLNYVKAGYYYGIKEAGHFQVYIGEYKKVLTRKENFSAQGIVNSKLISKSCRIINFINGDLTVKLYTTDILKKIGNKIILNSGGFKTSTTKERINQFLGNYGFKVYQQAGTWFINNSRNDKIKDVEFIDGIELAI